MKAQKACVDPSAVFIKGEDRGRIKNRQKSITREAVESRPTNWNNREKGSTKRQDFSQQYIQKVETVVKCTLGKFDFAVTE